MAQSTRLPLQWQSPTPPPPLRQINDLSDSASQFSPMSNDPFAKASCVKIIESMAIISQPLALPNEPQHTLYPDMLVNPPERWLRKSPNDPQPMRLIPPIPLSLKSSLWLDQQVKHQLGTGSSENKTTHVPVKPKPVKAPDLYRVQKPATNPRPRAPTPNKQAPQTYRQSAVPQRPQTMPSQPTSLASPNLPSPNWHQEFYGLLSSSTGSFSTAGYQGSYSNNADQISRTPPTRGTHPTFNSSRISSPNMAIQNKLPIPPISPMTTVSTQAVFRPNSYQQPYNPNKISSPHQAAIWIPTAPLASAFQVEVPQQNQYSVPPQSAIASQSTQTVLKLITSQQPCNTNADKTPLINPPAIRTPTTPLTSTFQLEMQQSEFTFEHYKPSTAAAEPTKTERYEEVYCEAKEAADNLEKLLGKK